MARMIRRRRISPGYRKYKAVGRISLSRVVIILFFLIIALGLGLYFGKSANAKPIVKVLSVSDGDTIIIENSKGENETIRMLGIDTPETHHPTKPIQCFGVEAENFTRDSLEGEFVELEYDLERYDKYGRTLAYIYIDKKRFNDILVENGFAKLLIISPNKLHAHALMLKELKAQNRGIGLWKYCDNENNE